ncbi:MAG: hypothetical protein ABI640_01120 [Gammaproteobacteria bacterium]
MSVAPPRHRAARVDVQRTFQRHGLLGQREFYEPLRITARPEDAERKRFLLELIPNEAQPTTTMKCPDVDLVLPAGEHRDGGARADERGHRHANDRGAAAPITPLPTLPLRSAIY